MKIESAKRYGFRLALAGIVAAALAAAPALGAGELMDVEGYPSLVRKPVEIWSDGTRLAGDVFYPKSTAEGEKLPTIVLCHGWGGTKAHLNRGIAPRFAEAGYLVLAFDYRGWGESDSRLVVRGEMPKPDEDGYVTVKAQAIRQLVDPLDQQEDIPPNVTAPILVLVTVNLGFAIIAEAMLSFLGLGPNLPSWGEMLAGEGRQYMIVAPWIALFPGLAITTTVLAFNLLGDAIRDEFDPRLRDGR